MLNEMFSKQKELLEFLYEKRPSAYSMDLDMKLFISGFAMLDEVHELLQNVNWKPWKDKHPHDDNNMLEEIVDIMHFLIQFSILKGFTAEDVFNKFLLKSDENKQRQINGGIENRTDYISKGT